MFIFHKLIQKMRRNRGGRYRLKNDGESRGGRGRGGRGRGGRGNTRYGGGNRSYHSILDDMPVNNPYEIIDIGINVTKKHFNNDRNLVFERAKKHNVKRMILTGTSIDTSRLIQGITKEHEGTLFSTVGVHPHDAKSFTDNSLGIMRELALNPQVVAIGECGLDFDRDFSPRDVQERVFEEQIILAGELKKPLFLHERSAFNRFVEIMEKNREHWTNVCVHCFTGTEEELIKYVEMGFYIGITGWVCDDRRGQDLQNIIKHIPLNRLMIETDSPFLLPRNIPKEYRVNRNEPCLLPFVLKKISECLELSEEEVSLNTTRNTHHFFNLPN